MTNLFARHIFSIVLISSATALADTAGKVKYDEFNAKYENMLNDVGGKASIVESSEREAEVWKYVKPLKKDVDKVCTADKGAMESKGCLAKLDKALKEMSDWDTKLQALIKKQQKANAKTEDKAVVAPATVDAQTDASKDKKKESKEDKAAKGGAADVAAATTVVSDKDANKKPGFVDRMKQKVSDAGTKLKEKATNAKQAIVSKFSLKRKP